MAFTFEQYGTFTGPGTPIEFRDNDDFSLDPFDGSFTLNDVSMVLANTTSSPADYVYFHLKGSNTKDVTLEASYGPIKKVSVLVENLIVTGMVKADLVKATQFVGDINVQGWKHFDVQHPTKKGHRLRHSCLEGPENAVYYRGRLVNNNTIELPEYWQGFIDPETITVNLTPHGVYQELFVKNIEWGRKVTVVNNSGGPIDCSYVICAERIDGEKLIVEYEGDSPSDYPGNYNTSVS
jgi:hypothetical protein